jgi:hypothetical protein
VHFTHQVGDELHSALIEATKRGHAESVTSMAARMGQTTLPIASDWGCC